MFHILFSALSLIAAWKWGDWRNWKLYYPTVLFVTLGDFIYKFLSFKRPLWMFESPLLGPTLSGLLIAFLVYPSLTLIYVPYFPKKTLWKKSAYISAWVATISIIEYLSFLLGFFSYHNGWNIGWSIVFNIMLFILVRIHYQKPLLGILIAALAGTGIMLFFKIPFPS